ncbi:hypothetical protein T484DRAFT_1827702 [Baffinella frigidus]|nr:hypothetical protein T484DRAFT_1827702 [Cryptophyta sp. CCMP2293]
MPLPFLDASDAQIFETFNGVILGWACLLFLPTWRHTKTMVLLLVFVYSLVR